MTQTHGGTVKFVLKFGKAEVAEMAVLGSWYSAPRNSVGAVVATLVTMRVWFIPYSFYCK